MNTDELLSPLWAVIAEKKDKYYMQWNKKTKKEANFMRMADKTAVIITAHCKKKHWLITWQ